MSPPTDSSLCIRHRVKVVHHLLIHGQELRLCILCLIHHLFHEHFLPSLSQGQMLSHHCSTFFGLTLQLSLVRSWPSWSVRAVAGMAGKSCDFLSRSFRQLHVNPSCQSLSYLPCVSGFCWPLFLRYSVVHDNIPYHLTPKPIPFSSIAWLVIAISSSFVHVRIAGFPPYRFLLFSDFYLIFLCIFQLNLPNILRSFHGLCWDHREGAPEIEQLGSLALA